MAEALYRKYRPQIFEDVVGQEHIERTIKNAIEQDKVSHAYLFTGPRGTGKTTTARLLAKALLCDQGPTPEPDGTCSDCEMIANGEHPDVYELDAASRTGVENVREEIIGRVQFAPTRGRYKVYIIDEVHMLSTAAFNALLKTLEEPPSHVVFILATTDPQKVPETIHSRCQRFDFRRISSEAIVSRLGAICVAEEVEFEGEALDLIAHRAEGGMRNALTSLEQLIAFGEGKVTLAVAERLLGGLDSNDLAEIMRAIGTRDVATCFRWTAEYIETGADLAQFTRDLAEHARNMYILSLAGADVALEVSDATRRELAEEMQWFGVDRLARLLGVLGDLSAELKTSTNPRLSFEIALTRMVRPDSDLTLASLAERVEALEAGYSAVAHVAAASAPAAAAMPASQPISPVAMPAQIQSQNQAPGIQGAPAPFDSEAAVASRHVDSVPHVDSTPLTPAPIASQSAPATPDIKQPPVASQTVPAQLETSLQNPAALQRVWQAALSSLKKNKAAYGVLFLNTKAHYHASNKMLVIEFPLENTFAFKAVQKPDVQDAVSAALAQACGAALPFSYAQGDAAGSTIPRSAAGEGSAPSAPVSTPAPAPAPPSPPLSAPVPVFPKPTTAQSLETAPRAPEVSAPAPAPAPADRPAPAPVPIPVPAPAPVPVPVSAPAPVPVPAPVPAPENTPRAEEPARATVSNNFDAPPYDDEVVPYGDELTPLPSETMPPEPDTRTSPSLDPTLPAQTPDEMEAILAAGFGDGVMFEEVRE